MKHKKEIIKKKTDNYFKHLSGFGSIESYFFVTLIFFALNIKEIYLNLILGIIIMYSIAIPIRLIFFKDRPIKEKYENFIEKISASSFPSTHAARSTFLILTILSYLNFELKITIVLSLMYISILYARIYYKRHYIKDLVGGVILGLLPYIIFYLFL